MADEWELMSPSEKAKHIDKILMRYPHRCLERKKILEQKKKYEVVDELHSSDDDRQGLFQARG